ncbi:MAG: phospholipid/cholesterol/gamma-HCH transport system permease protein [Verrucomicrobiota bacterium]
MLTRNSALSVGRLDSGDFLLCTPAKWGNFPVTMAEPNSSDGNASATIQTNPVLVVQGIGHTGRNLLREVGSMFWFIVHTFTESMDNVRRGRAPFRAASFFRHTERAGVGSVPLVAMVSFFLGLTMALLTGYQLERFGMERLIPGLVSIAFTRELGPLLTGIMLAARIGAAFTAELGTMKVSEEVEAIEAMGISPLRFLVAPRLLALFALMPCLSVISCVAAIFATFLISKAYFNIAWIYFSDLVLHSLLIKDIITGIIKSLLFGLLIGAISCHRGLNVEGGAAGVGTSTTSSVVTAITVVIGFDTLFNIVYTVFSPT